MANSRNSNGKEKDNSVNHGRKSTQFVRS